MKDIGHAELSANNLDTSSKLDLSPNASLAIFALPDANSISVAERVRKRLDELKKSFPEDLDYVVSLDMTPFIKESINEVIRTLIEAIVLVAIVVLLFLQNWRSALIPEGPMVVRSALPQDVKDKVTALTEALPQTDKTCAYGVGQGEIKGFVPVTLDAYEGIIAARKLQEQN